METASGDTLARILAEVQAVRGDMAALATSGDMMVVTACLLLLAGVVVGAVAALVVKEWFW